jgi:hypothetical protein
MASWCLDPAETGAPIPPGPSLITVEQPPCAAMAATVSVSTPMHPGPAPITAASPNISGDGLILA